MTTLNEFDAEQELREMRARCKKHEKPEEYASRRLNELSAELGHKVRFSITPCDMFISNRGDCDEMIPNGYLFSAVNKHMFGRKIIDRDLLTKLRETLRINKMKDDGPSLTTKGVWIGKETLEELVQPEGKDGHYYQSVMLPNIATGLARRLTQEVAR